MSVTARDTRAALKKHVVPLLRNYGFDDGTQSRLWHHDSGRIEHVELTCFSTYRASVEGTTTASFEVRLALSLPGYSAILDPFNRHHIKPGPKGPRPSEPQMPIRGLICPATSPPMTRGQWGWEVQSIWQINNQSECEEAAIDLACQFQTYALDWLQRDWDFEVLLKALETDETSPILVTSENGSYLRLNAERPGSPIRNAHIAMLNAHKSGGPNAPVD